MTRVYLSLSLCAAVVLAAIAGAAAPTPTIVMPGAEKYGPAPAGFPSGTMIAVLSGDPSKAGMPYTLRVKLPDGARVGVHTHGETENVTVMSGTFMVAVGDTFDASKLNPLPAGTYVSIPPGLAHYGMAKGETVVEISGVGPETTTFVK